MIRVAPLGQILSSGRLDRNAGHVGLVSGNGTSSSLRWGSGWMRPSRIAARGLRSVSRGCADSKPESSTLLRRSRLSPDPTRNMFFLCTHQDATPSKRSLPYPCSARFWHKFVKSQDSWIEDCEAAPLVALHQRPAESTLIRRAPCRRRAEAFVGTAWRRGPVGLRCSARRRWESTCIFRSLRACPGEHVTRLGARGPAPTTPARRSRD